MQPHIKGPEPTVTRRGKGRQRAVVLFPEEEMCGERRSQGGLLHRPITQRI